MMIGLACFALGVSLTLLVQYEVWAYRATRRPPSKQQVADLLAALSVWAEKFEAARPTKKHFRVREGELFEACAKVGTMWLRPRSGK